jgi:Fe2+ or Zn2+ uptake regulation protein
MRNTPVRRAAVEILETSPGPLSLRELHDQVRRRLPATAYSTIFRLVVRLEKEGRVNRIDWRERGRRFEGADRPHHHHIVCSDCGHTVDLDDRDLGFSERRVRSRTGFRVKHHSIELEGTCADCQTHHASRGLASG